MAFIAKDLKTSTTLTASFVTMYTVPTNKRTTITKATLHNYSAAAQIATVRVVESGGTPGDSHQIYEITVDVNETKDLTALRHTISDGAIIEAKADAATAINFMLSGIETTA